MIQCEISLKLNKYICYELTKVYIKKENAILVLKSSKKSMNLKDLHGNSVALLIYFISFADVVVIIKQQAGSMRIGASPPSRLSGKMTKATQIRI